MTTSIRSRRVCASVAGVALGAAGLLAAHLAPALADTATYVGTAAGFGACHASGPLGDGIPVDDTPGVGVGGSCFNVPAGASTVTLNATDDVSAPPAITVSGQVDRNPTSVGKTVYCNGAGTWTIPSGVTTVIVTTDDPVTSECANAGVPIKGTVTATFS